MNEALEQIRDLIRQADDALTRQAESRRTPRQRDDDFDEALRAHRRAAAILEVLRSQSIADQTFVSALAPLQLDVADQEILISEIRFDEEELSYRLPRLRDSA
jgi:hypothetical protein